MDVGQIPRPFVSSRSLKTPNLFLKTILERRTPTWNLLVGDLNWTLTGPPVEMGPCVMWRSKDQMPVHGRLCGCSRWQQFLEPLGKALLGVCLELEYGDDFSSGKMPFYPSKLISWD